MLPQQLNIRNDVAHALQEDVGPGDVSAAIFPPTLLGSAEIISREPMVVCGQQWVETSFHILNPALKIDWLVKEGQYLEHGTVLCQVVGQVAAILTAERTALNFLQTLSATATKTYRYVEKLKNYKARLLDTRKTLPGLRLAQKYAVRCGGGGNHRLGLYDAFLLKENHIQACGSIKQAVLQARDIHPNLLLEVEVENIVELMEAIAALPDRILLDNFPLPMLAEAVNINQKHCLLEASGAVSLETIAAVAATGVDFISVGELTKSIKAIDLSLLIRAVPSKSPGQY